MIHVVLAYGDVDLKLFKPAIRKFIVLSKTLNQR